MAFNINNLVPKFRFFSDRHVAWKYETSDTLEEVLTAGYFNTAAEKLRTEDFIGVEATDGNALCLASVGGFASAGVTKFIDVSGFTDPDWT